MAELPWIKWFPADWAADPAVAQTDISTRGVWIDMVNAMLLSGRPFVEGTDEQLARLCRCRPGQIQAAICEIRDFGVATVECKTDAKAMQNVCTKITCRRLLRTKSISTLRTRAASSRWKKPDANAMQTPASASAYASASGGVQGGNGLLSQRIGILRVERQKMRDKFGALVASGFQWTSDKPANYDAVCDELKQLEALQLTTAAPR